MASLSRRLDDASTRTSASPPLTRLGWLERTVRSTVFAFAAAGHNAIAATAKTNATSSTLNFLGNPCLLGETKDDGTRPIVDINQADPLCGGLPTRHPLRQLRLSPSAPHGSRAVPRWYHGAQLSPGWQNPRMPKARSRSGPSASRGDWI